MSYCYGCKKDWGTPKGLENHVNAVMSSSPGHYMKHVQGLTEETSAVTSRDSATSASEAYATGVGDNDGRGDAFGRQQFDINEDHSAHFCDDEAVRQESHAFDGNFEEDDSIVAPLDSVHENSPVHLSNDEEVPHPSERYSDDDSVEALQGSSRHQQEEDVLPPFGMVYVFEQDEEDDTAAELGDTNSDVEDESTGRPVECSNPSSHGTNTESDDYVEPFDMWSALSGRVGNCDSNSPERQPGTTSASTPPHPTFEGINNVEVNYDFYRRYTDRRAKGYTDGGASFPVDLKYYLDLLNLLVEAKVPNYLFDKIVSWATLASSEGVLDINKRAMNREKVIKQLALHAGLEDLRPKKDRITLPNAKVVLEVTTFDAVEAVLSLMTDEQLWRVENMDVFDKHHPDGVFGCPAYDYRGQDPEQIDQEYVLGGLFTGHLNAMVYDKRVKVEGRQVVVPIISFIDKTYVDTHGRLCQEPVCITLGIFNQATRNNPRAWRVLGYIPNQAMHMMASKPVDKLEDYHYVLRHILQPLQDNVLGKGGIYWEFPKEFAPAGHKGKDYAALLEFYYSASTGDNEGHDKCSAHFTSRSLKIEYPCRRCLVTAAYLDDPFEGVKAKRREKKLHICNYDAVSGGKGKYAKRVCNKYSFHYLPNGDAFTAAKVDMGVPSHISFRSVIDPMHAHLQERYDSYDYRSIQNPREGKIHCRLSKVARGEHHGRDG